MGKGKKCVLLCVIAVVIAAIVILVMELQGAKPKTRACGAAFRKNRNWALLVAGSEGWADYRFQANVCRAYQVLKDRNFQEDHIIVMMVDDVANDPLNPFKGKMYYHPDPYPMEVYKGCKIDYSGKDVTPYNFLRVLQGVPVTNGKRVIQTDKDSNLFIFISSHGYSDGDIAFPKHRYLQAPDFRSVLSIMVRKNKVSEVVVYLNACYSGLMFQNRKIDRVYAMTSATDCSSYGKYPNPKVYGKRVPTNLASQFADAWTDSTAMRWGSNLEQQFQSTKKIMTNQNKIYIPGQYSDKSFEKSRLLSCFFGYLENSPDPTMIALNQTLLAGNLTRNQTRSEVPK